jgi:hypothetical protein
VTAARQYIPAKAYNDTTCLKRPRRYFLYAGVSISPLSNVASMTAVS